MKQLIWKELREQRFVPVICSVLLLIVFAYKSITQGWAQDVKWEALDSDYPMYSWVLAAILASSLAFSAEFGNRTIMFLTALPIGYSRIWRAKVLAGLITVIVSMLCTTAVWTIAFRLAFGVIHSFPFVPSGTGVQLENGRYWLGDEISLSCPLLLVFLTAMACYGVGLVISPLTNRVLLSLTATSVACVGLPAMASLIGNRNWAVSGVISDLAITQAVYLILLPITLWASHAIFTKCHTFRPSPRFYMEVRRLVGWIGAGMLALRAGYMLLHLGF